MVVSNTQYIIFDSVIMAFVIVDLIRLFLVCKDSVIRHKQLGVYAVKLAMWLVCSIVYLNTDRGNGLASMFWIASAVIFSVAAFCHPYIKEPEHHENTVNPEINNED